MLNLESLKTEFAEIDFRPKRPGIYKVIIPYFYPDGDMYDVFIEESPQNNNLIRVSDHGLTLMKLSYDFDLDTPKKQEILENIVQENRCRFDDGNIYLDITPNFFTAGLYQFVQTITKASNMDIISRETMKSYFYEFFRQFMEETFSNYNIKKDSSPINDSELKVDFEIPAQNSNTKPIYIFGVHDNNKASKTVISCLTFNTKNIPYRSLIVPENINELSNFYRNQLINTCDKCYSDFEQFKEQGSLYLQRELT